MGTAIEMHNTEESFFFCLLLRLNAHVGCQIEDAQQKRVLLTMEGDERYTVS